MFRKSCGVRGNWAQFVIATAASVMACGTALAQQNEAITVTAPHSVVHTYVGRTFTGVPIEEASFTRQVGYSDLNLAMPAGAAALKQRVAAIAAAGCTQLAQSNPYDIEAPLPSNKTCLKDALDSAIPQANRVILAARK